MRSFTGGDFETNCYLMETPEGRILFDAPQESAEWLSRESIHVDLLLLTHGHFDHVADAAAIQREHGCPVGIHADGVPMISDPAFFRSFGIPFEVEPCIPDLLLSESPDRTFLGKRFVLLEVPGHCPGSICFLDPETATLIGGDVLFAGGVGRWDLPGGDHDLLIGGIQTKLLPLDDAVRVLPGHGPATTIGRERASNPYIS